ncbi:MAG TPA: hypothetical protein ENI20_08225 [Bacteroides sp.]|nr:hypothetical protein [Bacteroides sp.]
MKTSMTSSRGILGIILAISILFSISACKNQKTSESGTNAADATEMIEGKDALIKEISDYPLPTSFEVTTMLIEAGASYILNLCNHVDNVDKYINLKSKALNLGVYGADLSYAATYKQTQETMQYLSASAKLIDELQIGSFDEALVNEVESNVDDVDALITLISDSFYKTYEYLNNNEQDELSILVMAGSWIEAFYISTQISIISADNQKIVDVINDQRFSLEKLLSVMEPVSASEMSADVYSGLIILQKIYQDAGDNLSGESLESLILQTENLRTQIIS